MELEELKKYLKRPITWGIIGVALVIIASLVIFMRPKKDTPTPPESQQEVASVDDLDLNAEPMDQEGEPQDELPPHPDEHPQEGQEAPLEEPIPQEQSQPQPQEGQAPQVNPDNQIQQEDPQNTPWTYLKEQKLIEGMNHFSQEMGQHYQPSSPSLNNSWYGVPIFPDMVENFSVEGQPIESVYDPTGSTPGIVNVVSVWSDEQDFNTPDSRLYFFVISDGVADIIVTQSSSSDADGFYNFVYTENDLIYSTFLTIYNE